MSDHSPIPPSAAGIWGKPDGCTAWPSMAARFPEESGESAIEGEIAHELAAWKIRWLAGLVPADQHPPRVGDEFHGVIIPNEMCQATDMYATETMRSWGGSTHRPVVETKLAAPSIHENLWGTCDCYVYDSKSGVITVYDFKYGFGPVEVYENYQLISYAAAVLYTLGIDGGGDQHTRVEMVIVQPRAYHSDGPIRRWAVRASDLRPYFNFLRNAAGEIFSGNGVERTGKHCRYCPGRHVCASALKNGLSLYEVSEGFTPRDELTPDELGVQLAIVRRACEQLEHVKTGLEAQAIEYNKRGQAILYHHVEQAAGRLEWTATNKQIALVGERFGKTLLSDQPVTPKQAISKGIPRVIVDSLSKRNPGKMKVVMDDGKHLNRIFNKKGNKNE